MKITVSQKDLPAQAGKKILITFEGGKSVDKFVIDKADKFLLVFDRFLKKRKMKIESLQKADLEFENTGVLTERIIKATIIGLRF